MRNPIFINQDDQQLFDQQGYLVLPLLNDSEIEWLRKLFFDHHKDIPTGQFLSDSYLSDVTFKKAISDQIVQVLEPIYRRVFVDYQSFGASFLYKTPGSGSALAAHQDWSIVDEKRFVAINCWIPLDDIHSKNGALHVLPGSHSLNHFVHRAPTLPFFFSGYENMVHDRLVRLEMPAGTAVILDQSLIHYSSDNMSEAMRLAITAGVKSKGAPMEFHYFDQHEHKLHRYSQPEDFLLRFENFKIDIGEKPKLGNWEEDMDYNVPSYSPKEMVSMLDSFVHKSGKKPQKSSISWRAFFRR